MPEPVPQRAAIVEVGDGAFRGSVDPLGVVRPKKSDRSNAERLSNSCCAESDDPTNARNTITASGRAPRRGVKTASSTTKAAARDHVRTSVREETRSANSTHGAVMKPSGTARSVRSE